MEKDTIEEVMLRFQIELSRLGGELSGKEEERQRAREHLRNLPLISFREQPLKPILKWRLPRRIEKLGREVADLREKISQYTQAETELEQGEYEMAISLLDELANRVFAVNSSGTIGNVGISSIPSQAFYKITDLRAKLASWQNPEGVAK